MLRIVVGIALVFAVGFFVLFFHGRYPQRILNRFTAKPVAELSGTTVLNAWRNSLFQLDADVDVAFFGDSITQQGHFFEYFPDKSICNLGINGDKLTGMIERVDMITSVHPETVFLLGGINSLSDESLSSSIRECDALLKEVSAKCGADIYVISVLPISKEYNSRKLCSTDTILAYNIEAQRIAESYGMTFVNLYPLFATEDNHIIPELTTDGVHLTTAGYDLWINAIKQYVY